jgi:hypothetical protein
VANARLIAVVLFEGIPAGTTLSLPHGLNRSGAALTPDFCASDNGNVVVQPAPATDEITVTVTNISAEEQTARVWCEWLHSENRAQGIGMPGAASAAPFEPSPPFIPESGGAGAMADEKVKVEAADALTEFLEDKVVTGDGVTVNKIDKGGGVLALQLDAENLDAGNIDTGVPITVRGPTNAEGASAEIARADHDHRLEVEYEDEGILASARPRLNVVGIGAGLVDDPGNDRAVLTIPGTPSDGTVVKRSQYVATNTSTSGAAFVDGMSGTSVTVPIDGDYWAIFEAEGMNQSASGVVEIGISVDSLVAVVANSERSSQGPASDMRPLITTIQLPGLTAGQLVRCLFRKSSGAGSVEMDRRHLSIFKVQ